MALHTSRINMKKLSGKLVGGSRHLKSLESYVANNNYREQLDFRDADLGLNHDWKL